MNKIVFFVLLSNLLHPNIPKALEGQRNKAKIKPHQKFIKIEKSYISYVYELKENKVVSTNFDLKGRLTSKTNYGTENNQNIFFSGQITGVEGYVESAAIGNIVGRIISHLQKKKTLSLPPKTTAHGALLSHLTKNAIHDTFQPMNINFGLIDSYLDNKKIKGKDKKALQSKKALLDFKRWINKFI